MTAKRVFLRLSMSLAILFMVFWTFAYILHPTEVGTSLLDLLRTDHVFWPSIIAAAVLAVWVALGFRSN
jgi:hypothetical protein